MVTGLLSAFLTTTGSNSYPSFAAVISTSLPDTVVDHFPSSPVVSVTVFPALTNNVTPASGLFAGSVTIPETFHWPKPKQPARSTPTRTNTKILAFFSVVAMRYPPQCMFYQPPQTRGTSWNQLRRAPTSDARKISSTSPRFPQQGLIAGFAFIKFNIYQQIPPGVNIFNHMPTMLMLTEHLLRRGTPPPAHLSP